MAIFRFGPDFTGGETRLCWTAQGLEKLIEIGLWQREFDKRGNLKSKPLGVEARMNLPVAGRKIGARKKRTDATGARYSVHYYF
jgi:hypothetical protein